MAEREQSRSLGRGDFSRKQSIKFQSSWMERTANEDYEKKVRDAFLCIEVYNSVSG